MSEDSVALEAVYPCSPKRVWAALTDRNALARWLLPNDFEPSLGHRFTFTAPPWNGWNGIIECEVVELDEPHRLSFTWCGDPRGPHTLVSFSLETVLGGTRLRLEHTSLAAGASPGLSVGYALDGDWATKLRHLFQIQIDEVVLTDTLYDYLVDPDAGRTRRPVVRWLRALAPGIVPVIESMILDGVEERPDVAHFVHALADGELSRQLRSERLRRITRAEDELPSVAGMPRLFRLRIDESSFVDEAFAFVTTPDASRYDRPVVDELSRLAPDVLPVLETMVIEGVDQWHDVADYLRGTLSSEIPTE